jgi:branched-chain amino acid aminotransferase
MPRPPRFAWLNASVVAWDDCVLHARSQGAFWGANVFEGIRAYWDPAHAQLNVFRLDDHLERLDRSMKCIHMHAPYPIATIREACLELLRANEFAEDVHIVIVAYFGMGPNFDPLGITEDTGLHITAVARPRSDGHRLGVSASVSSWRRIGNDSMPPRIKTGANYHNSRLAQHEATRNGFDTTLILNQSGNVAEAPGACMMIVRNGQLITPPAASGALEGITLATVAEIAQRELGLQVTYRDIDRTELYVADEVFLCGTLAEILPIVSIDRLPVGTGTPGEITRELQVRYERAVRPDPARTALLGSAEASGWIVPAYAHDRLTHAATA